MISSYRRRKRGPLCIYCAVCGFRLSLVLEVGFGVGGDAPVQEFALEWPVRPVAGRDAPVLDHAAADVPRALAA